MTTRADTIARLLNQAGEYLKAAACPGNPQVYATSGPALSIDAAMRCINDAFLETLGSAAVAGEAAGPWVVRVVVDDASVWWASNGAGLPRRQRLDEAARFFSVEEAANMAGLYVEIGHHATVLPLAEAERMEAAATLGGLPAHTRKVLAELADEEPSAEVLAADDSPDEPVDPCARCGQERAHLLHAPISPGALCHGVGPLRDVYAHPFVAAAPTPSPPKPAGWVVRGIGTDGAVRFSRGGDRSFATDLRGAYVYESKPLADADAESGGTWRDVVVLPVDAAGNVIEAEGIGATLRREECERKAARQSGVAWEAARAGEEAERLRGELAAVKAERDAARADRDAALTEREDLRGARRALRYALRRVAEAVGGMVSSEASTEMHCAVVDEVRLVVEKLKREEALSREGERIARAERDALAAEVQRSREQKPVRWAVVNPYDAIVCLYADADQAHRHAAASGYRLAPLYLAPVVRGVSGVLAQCEEALRAWDCGISEVIHARGVAAALRAALAVLKGETK